MLIDFLEPFTDDTEYKPYQVGANVIRFKDVLPSMENIKAALIGIDDFRPGDIESTGGANKIRKELYRLADHAMLEGDLIDLGNIRTGNAIEDTRLAVLEVARSLYSQNVIPIFMGGNPGFTESIYHALGVEIKNLDITYLSSDLPMLEGEFLNRVCTSEPNYLMNLNVLGFQKHFIPAQSMDILENLGFNHIRLGSLKGNVDQAEPYLRNTHVFSVDLSVISQIYAPGSSKASISGIDSDMACQLSWYAGVSDTTKCYGLFGFQPELDSGELTAQLSAQMIWYFIDGVANRKDDHPALHDDFYRYRCNLSVKSPDILFFKSKRTNRWWMELPGKSSISPSFDAVIPCSYQDYQTATYGDLPERYLKALQHMH